METPRDNPQTALRGEILAQARRESEQTLQHAQQEAQALLAKVTAEMGKARQERIDQARAEAARKRELILATVPVEANRLRSAQTERLLQAIYEAVQQRLRARAGFDYRETLLALAVEAVSRMSGESFVVQLSAPDRLALGADLAEEITRRVGRSPLRVTIADDATVADGGLIVQDAEGRQAWDNHLSARLDRLWPELRRQIAVRAALVADTGQTGGAT